MKYREFPFFIGFNEIQIVDYDSTSDLVGNACKQVCERFASFNAKCKPTCSIGYIIKLTIPLVPNIYYWLRKDVSVMVHAYVRAIQSPDDVNYYIGLANKVATDLEIFTMYDCLDETPDEEVDVESQPESVVTETSDE